MNLTLLDKYGKSGEIACPPVYVSDTGKLAVQGAEVTGFGRSAIPNILPGETAVRISPEIVHRAIEKNKKNGSP